ncbi:hypothetical protein [Litoribaculum gwangyangense]|uniref:DUF4168 domain-containing protein n=1 Tax=Litoribaculum gwangyangense TaxID=1130722 RepID=A0ABP9CWX3_9FLAO
MRFLITIMVLMFALTLGAQPNPAKKAQKFADEMTEVLSLSKEESKAIYQIQLDRFKENQAIQKEYAGDPEIIKEKQKELGNKVYNQVKNVIGVERQKQWKAYKSKTK